MWEDYCFHAAGPILGNVMEACEGLDVNLVYFHTIKPIDKKAILRFKDTEIMVFHDAFGLDEAICKVPGLDVPYHGMPDEFCCGYGTLTDTRKNIGIDPESIRKTVKRQMKR